MNVLNLHIFWIKTWRLVCYSTFSNNKNNDDDDAAGAAAADDDNNKHLAWRQPHPQVVFELVLSRNNKYTVANKLLNLKKS